MLINGISKKMFDSYGLKVVYFLLSGLFLKKSPDVPLFGMIVLLPPDVLFRL